MSRQVRNLGKTGWAHIILRGINRENLFYDEDDYSRFLSTVSRFQKECGFELAALCMMSNHVHFLMCDTNGAFADIMKKITVSYAHYYNTKYERVGHVFQDRFRSEAVNDERYFLTVVRYIYQNPQKAGICAAAQYQYTVLNINGTLSGYFPDEQECLAFLNDNNDDRCLEYDSTGQLTDSDIIKLITELSGADNPQMLQGMEKSVRDSLLKELKHKGCTVRRLSRLTGINRNIIQRA